MDRLVAVLALALALTLALTFLKCHKLEEVLAVAK
jgi:hypothetical protein